MKRMTYEGIKRTYPDEWVLIDDLEVDDTLEVVSGIVLVHSPRRTEVDDFMLKNRGGDKAIRYTGTGENIGCR
ncbi:MAG: hypothetical protein ACE5I1_27845 [bacterium]